MADDAIADMLLGYVGTFVQASQSPHGDIHDFSYSPYVEDRYQFNKHLTLHAGSADLSPAVAVWRSEL